MFLKKLASRLMTRSEPDSAPVLVGAFGKHPGWNDHIDDIGLGSDLLVATKRRLYIEGIGGNIDSGAWEKLKEDQRLAEFDHLFLWRVSADPFTVVLGRFWSSQDGKGRSRYPMVVCAQTTGVPLAWVLTTGAACLERLKAACQATTSAQVVQQAVEAAGRELAAAAPASREPETDSEGVLGKLWSHADMGPDGLGMTRILYQIDREMGMFKARQNSGVRSLRDEQRPQHLRVPACADNAPAAARLWLKALSTQIGAGIPVLVIVPVGAGWVDLIVGEPSAAQFFVIRASRATIPLTTEIPYNIEPQFLRDVRQMVVS